MNVLASLVGNVLAMLLGVANSVIIARALGPAGKGEVALVLLVQGLVIMFGIPGLGPSTVFFVGRSKHPSEEASAASAAITLALLFAVGITALGLFVVTPLLSSSSFFDGNEVTLRLVFLTVPAAISISILSRVIQAKQHLIAFNAVLVSTRVIELSFLIGALLVFANSAAIVVGSYLVASFLGAGLVAFVARRTIRVRLAWQPEIWRRLIAFGVKGQIGNILYLMNSRFDYFFVGSMLGTAAVGLYSVAIGLAELLWLLPNAAVTVLLPRTAAGESGVGAEHAARLCRHNLLVALPAAVLLFALSGPLIRGFYGGDFGRSISLLAILLPGTLLFGVVRILGNLFIGLGKPLTSSFLMGLSLVLTVIGDLVLIPRMGLPGAALAATLAYAGTAAAAVALAKGVAGLSPRDIVVIRRKDLRDYGYATRNLMSHLSWSK